MAKVDKIDWLPIITKAGYAALGAGAVLAYPLIRKLFKGKGVFGSINRPTAGARFQRELPVGKHALQLYSLATPNGQKVTVALEELGIEYDAWRINIMNGDQFGSGFVQVNPNSKIPAMVDRDGPDHKPLRLFESGSILLYLADKHHKLIPEDPALRTECLNWLFFQMGAGPFIGQFGHFYKYAPEKIPYAIDRYSMEAKRILDVLDKHLQDKTYLIGDEYTIADIAWYPWVRCIDTGYHAAEYLKLCSYTHLNEWVQRIAARPAVQRGMLVNTEAQPERH